MKKITIFLFTNLIFLSILFGHEKTDDSLFDYFKQQKIEWIIEYLENPETDESVRYLFLGKIYALKRNYKKAEEYLNKIIKKKGKDRITILAKYIIEVMTMNDGYEEFIQRMIEKLELDIKNREYDQACYILEKFIEYEPMKPEYRLQMSQIGLALRYPELVIKQAKKVIDLKPKDKDILYKAILILASGHVLGFSEQNIFIDDPNTQQYEIRTNSLNKSLEILLEILYDKDTPEDVQKAANKLINQAIRIKNEIRKKRSPYK